MELDEQSRLEVIEVMPGEGSDTDGLMSGNMPNSDFLGPLPNKPLMFGLISLATLELSPAEGGFESKFPFFLSSIALELSQLDTDSPLNKNLFSSFITIPAEVGGQPTEAGLSILLKSDIWEPVMGTEAGPDGGGVGTDSFVGQPIFTPFPPPISPMSDPVDRFSCFMSQRTETAVSCLLHAATDVPDVHRLLRDDTETVTVTKNVVMGQFP